MGLYDISRTIAPGIAVWPGDTPFGHKFAMQMQNGDSCNVGTITMSVHTGSHSDAPLHFDDRGSDISGMPLEKYLGPATVVEISSDSSIEPKHLVRLAFDKISRMLFKTKASACPDDEWDEDFVYLSKAAAELLGEQGVQLVGLDSPSVDPFRSKTLAAHKILRHYEVAILEGLNLQGIPPGEYDLIALPLKLQGLDASPVRAILRR